MYVSILLIIVTVITQPHNVTGCAGGTVMFFCKIRFQNVVISKEDIKWWRRRFDVRNMDPQVIRTQGNNILSITSNIAGGTLTTVLMISRLSLARVGPYWLGMTNGTQLSDVAFLSITPSGMYAYCACVHTVYVSVCL